MDQRWPRDFNAAEFVTAEGYLRSRKTGSQKIHPRVLLSYSLKVVQALAKEAETEGWTIRRCSGFGAPSLAIELELLIAQGAREVVLLGTAGALNPDLKIGDTVQCEAALCDEGTSPHYGLPAGEFVSGSKRNLAWPSAKSWSTDAPYRETREQIAHYQKLGISVVDMEASCLFQVCKHRRAKGSAVFVISDLLGGEQWSPQFENPLVSERLLGVARSLLASEIVSE